MDKAAVIDKLLEFLIHNPLENFREGDTYVIPFYSVPIGDEDVDLELLPQLQQEVAAINQEFGGEYVVVEKDSLNDEIAYLFTFLEDEVPALLGEGILPKKDVAARLLSYLIQNSRSSVMSSYPLIEMVLAEETEPVKPEEGFQGSRTAEDYSKAFDLDKTLEKFIEKYKLANEIDIEDKDGEKSAKIKPEVAEKLARTFNLFESEEYAEKRKTESAESLKGAVLEMAKEIDPKSESFLTVDVRFEEGDDNTGWMKVSIEDAAGESTDLEVLSYKGDPVESLSEGAESWTWAAWLGVEGSPFFEEDFVDSYGVDTMSQAMDQFVSTLNESGDKHDLEDALKKMIENYEPVYEFFVNLDERGEFRADVRDAAGSTVFELESAGEPLELVEDGFMKHAKDLTGLEKYLKDTEVIPEKSKLKKGN